MKMSEMAEETLDPTLYHIHVQPRSAFNGEGKVI